MKSVRVTVATSLLGCFVAGCSNDAALNSNLMDSQSSQDADGLIDTDSARDDDDLALAGRLSGIKLFAHRFLPKIPPLSAFTTPPLRQPESVLLLDFAIWQGNAPKSPLTQRCVGQNGKHPPSSVSLDN